MDRMPDWIDFNLAQIEDSRHIEIVVKLDKHRENLERGLTTREEYLETLLRVIGDYYGASDD